MSGKADEIEEFCTSAGGSTNANIDAVAKELGNGVGVGLKQRQLHIGNKAGKARLLFTINLTGLLTRT